MISVCLKSVQINTQYKKIKIKQFNVHVLNIVGMVDNILEIIFVTNT